MNIKNGIQKNKRIQIKGILRQVVFSIVAILFLFPNFTHANVWLDIVNTGSNVLSKAEEAYSATLAGYDRLKESSLDPLARQIAQRFLEKAVNSTLRWVDSGFEGSSFYIENVDEVFLEIDIESASEFAAYYKNIYQDEVNRARDGGGVNADFSGNCDLLPEDQQNECFYEKNQCDQIDRTRPGGVDLADECHDATGQCEAIANLPMYNGCIEQQNAGLTASCGDLSSVEVRNQCYFKDKECDNIQTSYINDQGLAVAATNAHLANRCYVRTNQCTRIIDVIERRKCESKRQAISSAGQTARYTLLYLAENAFTDRTSSLESSNISSGFSDDFAVVETASDGSTRSGGWDACESIAVNSNNTPVGARFNAQQLITLDAEQAKEELNNTLNRSGGLRDQVECLKYEYRIEGDESTRYCAREQTVTPGSLINSQLQDALRQELQDLGNTKEWGEVFSTALAQLGTGLVQVGFSKIADTEQGFYDRLNSGVQDSITGFQNIVDIGEGSRDNIFSDLAFQDPNEAQNWTAAPTTFDVAGFLEGSAVAAQHLGFVILGDETSDGVIRITNSGNGQEIGRGVVDTASQVQLEGVPTSLSVDTSHGLSLLRITEDPTSALPSNYYFYDSSGQNLYRAVRKNTNEDILTIDKQQGARDQVDGMVAVLQAQNTTLNELAELTMNIDQACILGPDIIGLNNRINDATSAAFEKYSDEPDKRKGVNILKEYALRLTDKKMNDTSTDEGKLAAIYRPYVLENNRHKEQLSEIQRTLPEFYSLRSSMYQLAQEYEDPDTPYDRLQQVIASLYQINNQGRIPNESRIETQQSLLVELEASRSRYISAYGECQIELQDPKYTQARLYDDVELLYCPFEWFFKDVDNGFFGFGPESSDLDEVPPYIDVELGRLMTIDWNDLRVNADRYGSAGTVRTAFSSGREYRITSLIPNVNTTDVETHVDCTDYYHSTLIDYLPNLR